MAGTTAASAQAPCAVVMVRPHRFAPNPQTAADNAFQHRGDRRSAAQIAAAAFDEATQRVADGERAALARLSEAERGILLELLHKVACCRAAK